MLVITRTQEFGNRPGLSEPEKAKIWLKLSEINGQRTQIYARNQQIEQCEASEKMKMLVKTERLEFGRKGCEVTGPNQGS